MQQLSPVPPQLADDVQTIMKGQLLIEPVHGDGRFVPRRTPDGPPRRDVKMQCYSFDGTSVELV